MKDTILKNRIKIIKKENSLLQFTSEQTKLSEFQKPSKIDKIFEDKLWAIKKEINRRKWVVSNYGKSKTVKNNEKIIKKYWGINESKLFNKFIEKYGLIDPSEREGSRIFRLILGKNNSEKIRKELKKQWELGKTNGPGNAMIYFIGDQIMEKAKKIKLDKSSKNCKYCSKKFYPLMTPFTLLKYYPIKTSFTEIKYCPECLASAFLGIYKEKKTREEMKLLLKKLIDELGFIPSQDYFLNVKFTQNIPLEKLDKLMKILIEIPPYSKNNRAFKFKSDYDGKFHSFYKDEFSSWFHSLIESEVLEEEARKLPRGVMCLAKDNHLCLSMAEKSIDDWLFEKNIPHRKEPIYPKDKELNYTNLRADWEINGIFIEYFGLKGESNYDKKIEIKKTLAKKYKIKLIEIYQEDLKKLNEKLGQLKQYSQEVDLLEKL